MDVQILSIQARVLLWVGLVWLAAGLWQGFDPAMVAWRAVLGATVAMWLAGFFLRRVQAVITERLASDLAERELASRQQQAVAAPVPAKPVAVPAAKRR